MKYQKAESVFPKELLNEIQKYVQGEMIYIPKPKHSYKKWGDCSGSRQLTQNRNQKIRFQYDQGKNLTQLANEFYLSVESIKKIIYKKQ